MNWAKLSWFWWFWLLKPPADRKLLPALNLSCPEAELTQKRWSPNARKVPALMFSMRLSLALALRNPSPVRARYERAHAGGRELWPPSWGACDSVQVPFQPAGAGGHAQFRHLYQSFHIDERDGWGAWLSRLSISRFSSFWLRTSGPSSCWDICWFLILFLPEFLCVRNNLGCFGDSEHVGAWPGPANQQPSPQHPLKKKLKKVQFI